ncbi:unnamed protein product [Cochlearia groenlandica]
MEEHREEGEFVNDYKESMEEEEDSERLGSKTETLDCDVDVEESLKGGDVDKGDSKHVKDDDIENAETARIEIEREGDVEVKQPVDEVESYELCDEAKGDNETTVKLVEAVIKDETGVSEIKSENGASHESVGEDETLASDENEVRVAFDAEQSSFGGEMVSVVEDGQEKESTVKREDDHNETNLDSEADQEKESTKKSEEEDNSKTDSDNKQAKEENVGSETNDVKHSESAQVQEESNKVGTVAEVTSAAEIPHGEDITDTNQNEEHRGGEAMEIDIKSELINTVESAASGEVEPSDHNAVFDPSSDITHYIDFSGVSSWSGNVQDHKTKTGNAESSQEVKKATDTAEEVASVDCMGSEENQEDKDQQDDMREEGDNDITHEDPNQKEDTEMEKNQHNSDNKTNGVKRKSDDMSEEDSQEEEGKKTPSVSKGNNLGDETLSVESFVSQLHCAATEPDKDNVVSDVATGFFVDFRNSSATEQVVPEKVSTKRVKTSDSNAGGAEAFEFEDIEDTYWINHGKEEQTQPQTEKGNYKVVPVELKPSQVQRTRRPYRRRQSQISTSQLGSEKPADFDENAPAELIVNFSETDTIPPEKSLSKMFRRFGPVKESQTEVDRDNNRARVVFKKGSDAEVAYNSAGRFNIFGTKAVNYELSYTVTETFKVQPYVVSLSEDDASALCLTS